MADPRLDPQGLKPSDTEADVMQTIDGVAKWAPAPAAGIESVTAGAYVQVDATDPAHIIVSAMVPLTTIVGGLPEIVFDTDGQIVYTEAP